MRLTAKSTTRRVAMSIPITLNPAGVMRRVVIGAASPKQATKASPAKPKSPPGEKSNPLAAAWAAK
jgi:hypothetical protein